MTPNVPFKRFGCPGSRELRLALTSFAALAAVFLCLAPAAIAETGSGPTELAIESYSEDFGVPKATAEANLETQEQGAGMVELLEHSEGSRYAGVWFDNQSGEFVIPTVGAGSRSTVESNLAGTDLQDDFRTKAVQFSWQDLEVAHTQIDRELLPLIEANLVETSLDPRTNAVVIHEAGAASQAEQTEIQGLVEAADVKVEIRQGPDALLHSETQACRTTAPRACDRPLRGGVELYERFCWGGSCVTYHGECTAGFKATGFGNSYMLTAGHCDGDAGATWGSSNANGEDNQIGYIEASSYPTHDWARLRVNGPYWLEGAWPSQVAHYWEDQNRAITAESVSYMGEYVCHSGTHSGTSCGNVKELDATVNDGWGTIYHETKFGNICSLSGDSGGPVFAGNTALGLFTATNFESQSPNCISTGVYVEITEATDWLGVTVAPRVGAAPTATTAPGVSAFPLHGTTVDGTVDSNGLATTYYFQYGPTASYGSSTSSQNAGSGWQPAPVSGTLTGLKGLTGYHFRLVASNSAGTSYGVDQVFSTPDWRPTIAIDPATSRTTKSAVLNARINPLGSATTYYIEWGESGVFGSKVPVSPANIGSGTSDVAVSQEISGLTAEREYHYRVVATSSEGTTYSPEKVVWTKAQTPTYKLAFGSSGSGDGQLKGANGVAVDASGNIWVADTENNRIEKFSPEGAYLSKFGSLGSANGQFNKPTDLTVAPNGNLWVVDSGNSRIQQLTPSGEFVSKFGSYGSANNQFIKPFGIASSPNGNLWITDVGASNLKEFQATGSFIRIGGNNFLEPKGLAVDYSGYVWVADSGNDRIQVISPTGAYAFQFSTQGSGDGQLSEPSDVAIRGSGTILVVDTGNDRLQQFGPNAEWFDKYGTLGSGNGQLSDPRSIALAPGGLEYIADTGNNRVQKWQQTGDYESRWHSENLGGVLTADPEICSWGSSHIEVFGRGTDNALWHRYWNGSTWSGWESLGGSITSAPGCVSWGANRLDVVARATDGSVAQWAWNGSSWASGTLGGTIYGDPDIASWGPNRLDVFGRAGDGSIAHKAWTGASWSSWENLGGANAIVSGVGAVGSNGNRIDAVGRAANGSVFHLYFLGGWYTANQGGSIKGDPDVTSWGFENYNLWARSAGDDMLNTKYWTGSAWSAWESTKQGPLSSSPGAISFEPGRFDVVTLDANGSVRHWWWR